MLQSSRGTRQVVIAAVAVAFDLAPSTVTTAAAQPPAAARSPAGQEYDRGIALYLDHDYAAAVRAFSRSYAIDPRRETLFAWAQAERLQGNCPGAIQLYDRYLAQGPPAAQVPVVQEHLARCRSLIVPPWYSDLPGDLLVGTGTVGLLAGTWYLASSVRTRNERDAATTDAEYLRLANEARRERIVGLVAFGTGAALVTAGIVRFLVRSPPGAEPPDPGAPRVVGFAGPRAAGLGVELDF